jgi:hypothetical protein
LDLKEFADQASPFLYLEDGDSIELVYKKFEVMPSKYDKDRQTVEYTFEDKDGNEKIWTNGSAKVARVFAGVKEGEVVIISKEGEERNTKYTIKKK